MKRELKRVSIEKGKGYVKIPAFFCDILISLGDTVFVVAVDDDKKEITITGSKK